jgi:hypothetical protein
VPENRSDGPPAPEKKIALFRSLFREREDAYAGVAMSEPGPCLNV